MSSSFANQTIAQIELYTRNEAYKSGEVYVLPKHLDEKVARLHLKKLGVNLTTLRKDQADYISVPVEGPTSRITTATDACSKIGDATPCRRGVFRFQGKAAATGPPGPGASRLEVEHVHDSRLDPERGGPAGGRLPAARHHGGLFLIVINALLFWFVGSVLKGFQVNGFWWAVGGAILYSIISGLLTKLIP